KWSFWTVLFTYYVMTHPVPRTCLYCRQLLLQLLLVVSYVIADFQGIKFVKHEFDPSSSALTKCNTSPIDIISPMQKEASPVLCQAFCIKEGNCTHYSIQDGQCKLYSLALDVGYSVPTDSARAMYSRWQEPNMALGATIKALDIYSGYPSPDVLINGILCWDDPLDCFCTTVDNSWITVDLGAQMTITKVVITTSFDYDTEYFASFNIHIGSFGNSADPKVAEKNGDLANEKE
ncbi:unnamed protein product, partial [Meganyctiphanes norvegica]